MKTSNLSKLRPQPKNADSENSNSQCDSPDVCVTLTYDDNDDGENVGNDTKSSSNGPCSFNGTEQNKEKVSKRSDIGSNNSSYESLKGMSCKGSDPGSSYESLNAVTGTGPDEEEEIKKKLKFFFLNPIEKYYATRQLPWKLFLQILKVFLVTAQLWQFAEYRYKHVNYYTNQKVTLDHFFIQNWDLAREIEAYPPSTGKLAVYGKEEFFDYIDFAVQSWANIENDALGPFFRNSSLEFCVKHYEFVQITRDLDYNVDTNLVHHCMYLEENQVNTFNSSKDWMVENMTMPWYALEMFNLNFNLTSVSLKPLGLVPQPNCFQFRISIRFNNKDHDGQLPLHLNFDPVRLRCPSQAEKTTFFSQLIVMLNLGLVIVCLISLLLCLRALLRAELLKHETQEFLSRKYNWRLSINERMEFLNLWYVMICANDSLVIMASILKHLIETRFLVGDVWDLCSLMLGTGSLLVWLGILRYVGFFKTYNVLILTMKGGAPNMFRFSVCAFLIYVGFTFAGWVVLGPYHFKFETLTSTAECLFSLINGDDMFPTFSSIPMEKTIPVWIYSRIYLYSFISLFIYIVLSLFISIIMDTYEIIKHHYNNGFPPSRLECFYSSCEFDFSCGQYSGESILVRIYSILRNRCIKKREEYEQLD